MQKESYSDVHISSRISDNMHNECNTHHFWELSPPFFLIAIIAPTTINTPYSYHSPFNFVAMRSKTADINTNQKEN